MMFNHVRPGRSSVDIKQVNSDSGRQYQIPGGKLYPSVTTVLSEYSKQAITEWRNRVGEDEANRVTRVASSRGTRIHKLCENYLGNNPTEYKTPLDRVMFESMKPLLHRIGNVHVLEHSMYSNHLRLAGTVDCVAEFDGKLSVIDFKTASKQKRPEWIENYFMQCAAYAVMYEELYGEPVSRLAVMIGVDDDEPQLFQEKRDTWVGRLINYRNLYEERK